MLCVTLVASCTFEPPAPRADATVADLGGPTPDADGLGAADSGATDDDSGRGPIDATFDASMDGAVSTQDVGVAEDATLFLDADSPDVDPPDLGINPNRRLAFTTPARTIRTAECSGEIEIERQNLGGAPRPVPNDQFVQLVVAPPGAIRLFADRACTIELGSTVVMPALTSRLSLHATAQANATLTATLIDTLPASQSVTAASCGSDCLACNGGCCGFSCIPNGDCAFECGSMGCPCTMDCRATTGTCELSCTRGRCAVDCEKANNCEISCSGAGTRCSIRCDEANNCDSLTCTEGAECVAFCRGASTCEFVSCSGGRMTCPNNVIVCNRNCP